MGLSIARQRVLLSGQTAAARKVFELVPIQAACTAQHMQTHLQRITRSTMEFRILQGCLNTLKQAGLVVETEPGYFQRAKPRETTEKKMTTKATESRKCASAELLQELAERTRKLASDLDEAVIMINEEHENNAESVRKLGQLQALLKSLS